jgi:ABC-2 type transport system permease protein
MAFCGVSVPVTFWPAWVEVMAHMLPLTHGLEAMRLLLDQAGAVEILKWACLEVLVGAAWLAASLLLIDRMADAGRQDGSIEFVS